MPLAARDHFANTTLLCHRHKDDMSEVSVDQAMQIAIEHHQAGRLQQAEQIYQQILAQIPAHAGAMHHLGLIAHRVGRFDNAVDFIRRSIASNPNDAEARYNLGIVLKDKGQLDEAITAYRQALALRPNYAEAHNSLGVALTDSGQLEEAIVAYRRAIALVPQYAEAYNNLGVCLKATGRLDEAIAAYRQAIALRPDYVEARSNVGDALTDKGQLDEAIAALRQAIALRPDLPEAYSNLGNALKKKGQLDEAIAAFRQAIAFKPNYAQAYCNLGNALTDKGLLDEAIAAFRQAIAIVPNYAEAFSNLGVALNDKGQVDEAIAAYHKAIALRPNYAGAHSNLGNALKDKGQLDEAVAAYRQAIALRPNYAEAHSNLGNALKDRGQLDEAIVAFRQASVLKPAAAEAHSNVVYTACLLPDYGPQKILDEARAWARQHVDPVAVHIHPHDNDRSLDRPLRVGYVSPNFQEHVVGRNVFPLLENHDRRQFQIHCFSGSRTPDALTHRFRQIADRWHDIVGMSDAGLADLVRRERIDVLVDLNLHMAGSRLLTFARKPAPVQVTWAGYPGTTGLDTIDYRLTDPYLDPPGTGDECYSERSIRLPHSFWCFRPAPQTPEVSPLPRFSNGFVTFGCLNNFCKVTPPALDLWARTMQSVANSRLLILSPYGSHREQILRRFQVGGVEAHRIEFVNPLPFAEYMCRYHLIDIALDSLPYTGHSTSLDAFWMGVPVVTLAGETAASRGGVSIASNLGMTDLIARTPEQYVGIAARLAGDPTSLSGLRSTLRGRMQRSPLMDERRFTRNVEAAYWEMWRRWCLAGEQQNNIAVI